MKQLIPRVHDGVLAIHSNTDGEQEFLRVGSSRWFKWIETTKTFLFDFSAFPGEFTARQEKRAGNWYWYAYHRGQGKFRRAYLGKSTDVTAEHLHEVAMKLRSARRAPTAGNRGRTERMTSPPLLTKLTPPTLRSRQIVPTHALERMQHVVDFPLTLLSATAGWGKTTLLAQWVAAAQLPVAWVSLDVSDTDPAQFWKYVLTALDPRVPGLSQLMMPKVQADKIRLSDEEMADLINLLMVAADPVILVIDNYHHVAEVAAIHDALAFLISHLPPNIHIVLASRTEPVLPLAQLRARGQLNELRANDLRFTTEEATQFLALAGITLSDDDLALLALHIDGWIAGWQLAAISLQRDDDTSARVAAFDGSHRYVVDFLTEEILKRLPADLLTFLLQTAILDTISAPLCDMVRDATDSRAMIEQLKRINLFIEPTDAQYQWSRYHPLFADMLQNRLLQAYPERVPDLYHRASIWFANQGQTPEAVEYAFKANDVERAAQLIEAAAESLLARGDVPLLRRWLGRLPSALIRERSRLNVLRAYGLFDSAQFDEIEQCVRDAELQSDLIPPAAQDIFRAEIQTLHGVVAAHQGMSHRSITLCQQAMIDLPENHAFHSIALLTLGIAYSQMGDIYKAAQKLDSLKRQGEVKKNAFNVAMSDMHLGQVRFLQGKLRESLNLSNQAEVKSTNAMIAINKGRVLYEVNDLETATNEVQRAIDLQQTVRAMTCGLGMMAQIYQAQGDLARAEIMLERALAVAQDDHPRFTALLQAQRARLALAGNDLEQASHWTHELAYRHGRDEDEIAAMYEHITLARVYLAQGHRDDALMLLRSQRAIAESSGHLGHVIEILALQALVYDAMGETHQAHETLSQALTLGEPEGFVRTFVDAGRNLQSLLMGLHTERRPHHKKSPVDTSSAYLEKILQAFGSEEFLHVPPVASATKEITASQALIDPLSSRELEVLRLLAQGASNQDLARGLVIAVGTVKRHVSNIFMKLGVQSRTQAIARAHLLDLVDLTK